MSRICVEGRGRKGRLKGWTRLYHVQNKTFADTWPSPLLALKTFECQRDAALVESIRDNGRQLAMIDSRIRALKKCMAKTPYEKKQHTEPCD